MYAEAVPNGGAGIVNALVNIESRYTVDRNRYRDAEGERVARERSRTMGNLHRHIRQISEK